MSNRQSFALAIGVFLCLMLVGVYVYRQSAAPSLAAQTQAASPNTTAETIAQGIAATQLATTKVLEPATNITPAQVQSTGLEIRTALYGDLPDGTAADVTAIVAALVKDNRLTVTASNELFGDPTPGIVKKLRVRYVLEGVAASRTVDENEVMTLGPSRLTIVKAEYGDLPRGARADVTDKVAQRVANDALSVEASNTIFDDPALGVVKQLRVDYLFEGQAHSKTVEENQTLQVSNTGE